MTESTKTLRKVAIFDIDGTIFRSSLLIELVEMLIELGLFPLSVRQDYEDEKVEWLERKGDYESYIMAVVKVFVQNIKGMPYTELQRASELVVARYRHRTYKYTEELIKELKKDGYFLLAISQSPKTTLDFFCNDVGFDKTYGRIYETDEQGLLTGNIVDEPVIALKANIVRRACEKEGLTLEGSVGVGDTEGDISMLEIVERPICFNPNKKLYDHAMKEGWEAVIERKDVIHKLNTKETN
ncbi:MAG: HAD-IB family phosphatase [Candidatus Pacebacteria bacterium]|jgi:HAD superfamily hydrolase (TIGR01490 family)|nr:HAD-IB family phosphatase [Candidatus Paceibacterota bacterium]